jgi:hypothetical protein
MRNYRDLEVWKLSHKLTLELYAASKKFPKDEMFGLTSQLRRAASLYRRQIWLRVVGVEPAPMLASFGSRWAQPVSLIIICFFAEISNLYRLSFMSGSRKT